MSTKHVVTAAIAACAIATAGLSGGCAKMAWWTVKKAGKEEGREIGEKVGVVKSKEDLKKEIAEQKQECSLKQDELRKQIEELKKQSAQKEDELNAKIHKLQDEYDAKVKELEKQLKEQK